jgi:hypothetical protein
MLILLLELLEVELWLEKLFETLTVVWLPSLLVTVCSALPFCGTGMFRPLTFICTLGGLPLVLSLEKVLVVE